MGLLDGAHARALRSAQNLWDRGRTAEAIGMLESTRRHLWPRVFATDALILATLATYVTECGDPMRGQELLQAVPLNDRPRTDAQLICLGARCSARAAAGNLAGARADRDAIFEADSTHAALAVADAALREGRRSILVRAAGGRSPARVPPIDA